jgi:ABC-type multidrug transport system permease subunit
MSPRIVTAIVSMRLRRLLAERSNVIWLLLMPLAFTFIMSQLMGNWSASSNLPSLRVYGLGQADPALRDMVDGLGGGDDFRVDARDTTSTASRARWLLEGRYVSGVLLVGEGYADSLAAGERPHLRFFYDSDRTSSQGIRRAFDTAFARLSVRSAAERLVDPAQAASDPGLAVAFDDSLYARLVAEPRVRLVAEVRGRSQVSDLMALDDSRQHTAPSYTLMFILMFMLLSAKDLVTERRNRTLDRLRLTHASPSDLMIGFFAASFVVGLVQGGLLLAINAAWTGIDYGDSAATLVTVMVLFAGMSAAAGLLLGSLAASGGQADGLGMVFGLGLPALGGLWWPLEVTPAFMQTIGRALPTGQAITVFHDMIGRGHGLAETAPMLVGLAFWLVVLLGLAVIFFRRQVAR